MGGLIYQGANDESVLRRRRASAQPSDVWLPLPSVPRVVIDTGSSGLETGGARSHDVLGEHADRNQEFLELLAAYRVSGGLARAHEVMALSRSRNGLTTEQLARWIVTHQIISFDWQDQTWFPWFQFEQDSGRPRPWVGETVQVLCSFLDSWQIACWFVRPAAGIDDRVPLDELGSDSFKVLAAAQTCRMRYDDPE